MDKKQLQTKNPRLQNLNPMFHFKTPIEDDQVLTKSLLMQARKSGVLNLSNKGLGFGEYYIRDTNYTNQNKQHANSMTIMGH